MARKEGWGSAVDQKGGRVGQVTPGRETPQQASEEDEIKYRNGQKLETARKR